MIGLNHEPALWRNLIFVMLTTLAGSGFARDALASPEEAEGVPANAGPEKASPELASAAGSQEGSFLPLDPFHAGLSIGSGVGWFTSQTVNTQALGKVGPTFHAGVSLELYDLLSVAFSAGTIFVKDKASFNQTVVDTYGRTSDASSSANITILGLSAGLRTPDLCLHQHADGKGWLATNAYVRYGLAWVSGDRVISNCKDCDSSPLSLDGGQFVESGIKLGSKRANAWGIAGILGYRQYFAGASPSGEVQLAVEVSYW
ncbi:MAG TPA: hypothetical protein VKP30_13315 [Polyangiaceae bacterium]|nr:hypothetical protein [Polyangiaceae bacterium]